MFPPAIFFALFTANDHECSRPLHEQLSLLDLASVSEALGTEWIGDLGLFDFCAALWSQGRGILGV